MGQWAGRRVGTGGTHIPPTTSYGESVFPPEVTVRIEEAHRADCYEAKTRYEKKLMENLKHVRGQLHPKCGAAF